MGSAPVCSSSFSTTSGRTTQRGNQGPKPGNAIRQAEATRKGIDGDAQTDWTLNKHHKDDEITLRAIMSAGLWDKHLLHKAGLAMDSKCDRCGNARDDTCHRFWECAALRDTYDQDPTLFKDFCCSACITTCGLATELAGWTGGKKQEQQTQRKSKHDEWQQVQQDMKVEGKTARQVLADCHGPDGILDLQLPPRLRDQQEPPQQANTFTDASVLVPKTPWASFAGIGIVHIDRDMNTYPLHNIEMELMEPRSSETRRQQTMSSSTNNSTRMERTAAIIATYAPRPITIAIDNQAVVEGFTRIKDRRDKPTRWIDKPDGDLRQFWEKAIVTGGVETINVKWIPGHQTQQDWPGTRARITTRAWPCTRRRQEE